MKLGDNILKLRKKQGLSQEQLGEQVGVTRQTISNWELSETSPNPEQLKLLSKALNSSIDELLDNNMKVSKKESIETDSVNSQKTRRFLIIATFIGVLLVVGLLIFCFANIINKESDKEKDVDEKLTIGIIKEIAKKGEEVSWEDFKKYKGKEIGSGLRIIYYEIEGIYDLMIGGTSEYEKPMYVRLVLDTDKDQYIDIRNEDMEGFIRNTKKADTSDVPVNLVEEKKQ